MFRKSKTHISYKKDGVIIRPASLDEEYEIGGWASSCPWIRVGYEYDGYRKKYSDITYVILLNDEIIGYFMAHSEINTGKDMNLPLYSNELILHDFAVDTRAYAKYSKILIDYIIRYAEYNGYRAVTLIGVEKYKEFVNFIGRHYKITEADGKIYLPIESPKINGSQRHLTVYEGDRIGLEHLYFLYDLSFDISRTECKRKLNDKYVISIDRSTGAITFPEYVRLTKDAPVLNDSTAALIYLVVSTYIMEGVKPVTVDYDSRTPDRYEAVADGLLYVSKSLNELRADSRYISELIERGYTRAVPSSLKYDMNDRSFSEGKVIYKLVK